MNILELSSEFKSKVCEEISLVEEGLNRFVVLTPFMFDDGDHLVIVLKSIKGKWFFTDEGHTFMHISYDDIDIDKGARKKIVDNALSSFGINDSSGELLSEVTNRNFGDTLFSFVQGLIKVTDVTYLSRERVRSTFTEDFFSFLESIVPKERRQFHYIDKQHDSDGKYEVDCKVNGMVRPVFVFGIQNDDKCRDATIICNYFEKSKTPFRSLAIFEDQEQINRRVLARFSDVCDKQFSNLAPSNQERITNYVQEVLEHSK